MINVRSGAGCQPLPLIPDPLRNRTCSSADGDGGFGKTPDQHSSVQLKTAPPVHAPHGKLRNDSTIPVERRGPDIRNQQNPFKGLAGF